MSRLSEIIERVLDGSDYDQGQLEDLQHTVDNLRRALSILLAESKLSQELLEEAIGYISFSDTEEFEQLVSEKEGLNNAS